MILTGLQSNCSSLHSNHAEGRPSRDPALPVVSTENISTKLLLIWNKWRRKLKQATD